MNTAHFVNKWPQYSEYPFVDYLVEAKSNVSFDLVLQRLVELEHLRVFRNEPVSFAVSFFDSI
jgi:hypothetical protein